MSPIAPQTVVHRTTYPARPGLVVFMRPALLAYSLLPGLLLLP